MANLPEPLYSIELRFFSIYTFRVNSSSPQPANNWEEVQEIAERYLTEPGYQASGVRTVLVRYTATKRPAAMFRITPRGTQIILIKPGTLKKRGTATSTVQEPRKTVS